MKIRILLVTAMLTAMSHAYAYLGGAPSDIGNNGAATQSPVAVRLRAAPGSTVRESTTAYGTMVKEYIGTDGVVFAVSWRGPFMPNLQLLLDGYFNKLKNAQAAHGKGHNSPRVVTGDDVVIESSGHVRDFHGYAYIPSRLPVGFSVSDIQR